MDYIRQRIANYIEQIRDGVPFYRDELFLGISDLEYECRCHGFLSSDDDREVANTLYDWATRLRTDKDPDLTELRASLEALL